MKISMRNGIRGTTPELSAVFVGGDGSGILRTFSRDGRWELMDLFDLMRNRWREGLIEVCVCA